MTEKEKIIPGLEGVPIAESEVSYIDGEKGILEYRGFPIQELVEKSSFEENSFLLLKGRLPTREELKKFDNELKENRELKFRFIDILKSFPDMGHPMNVLQASVAILGMYYPIDDVEDEKEVERAVGILLAKIPTIIAAWNRIRHGFEPLPPRKDLSHSANFLYMILGKEPDDKMTNIMDASLICHADHTMNASTFTARVVTSTQAKPHAVIASAIGALSGPLHGGANEHVVRMLRAIGSIKNVRPYIQNMIRSGSKIMGLGHRVYKVKDPRASILQKLAELYFASHGSTPLFEVAKEVEKYAVEILKDKKIYPNVDFYSGIIYERMGIPTDLYTPIFVMARIVGWLAHWREQLVKNRIFRPTQVYVGEHGKKYIPVDQR
ncbi:MAG: citrate synthase [Spirochaetales bacterium]|nr:citrate synthase [Spirochaetales bacterium]